MDSQAYIKSQAHAGWSLIRAKYDDGGFSGGNTERPALQRLLEDVRTMNRLNRFFKNCSRLTESLRNVGKDFAPTRSLAFDAQEARRLPDTIRPWIASQPAVAEARVPRERLEALVDSLSMLSARLCDLLELRASRQAVVLRNEYGADIRARRIAIQDILNELAADPSRLDSTALRGRLDAELEMLTNRIDVTLNSLPADALPTEELLNMYRLLGAYRGLSEALILVVDSAARIDWNEMREERF